MNVARCNFTQSDLLWLTTSFSSSSPSCKGDCFVPMNHIHFFSLSLALCSWGACRRWLFKCRLRWRWRQTSERASLEGGGEDFDLLNTLNPWPPCSVRNELTASGLLHPHLHVCAPRSFLRNIHPSTLHVPTTSVCVFRRLPLTIRAEILLIMGTCWSKGFRIESFNMQREHFVTAQ